VKFAAARDELKSGFGRGAAAEKARGIVEDAEKDHDFAAQVKLASSYRELARARPVLFPVASDAASKTYAQALRRFLKEGLPEPLKASVQALLDRFEK
jgi:hypothetical protein